MAALEDLLPKQRPMLILGGGTLERDGFGRYRALFRTLRHAGLHLVRRAHLFEKRPASSIMP